MASDDKLAGGVLSNVRPEGSNGGALTQVQPDYNNGMLHHHHTKKKKLYFFMRSPDHSYFFVSTWVYIWCICAGGELAKVPAAKNNGNWLQGLGDSM